MATRDLSPRGRGHRRRQTRTAPGSDEDLEPIAIARRATRRTSTTVSTLHPASDGILTDTTSLHEDGVRSVKVRRALLWYQVSCAPPWVTGARAGSKQSIEVAVIQSDSAR